MDTTSYHKDGHHSPCSPNYRDHVLSIGRGNFCIGCLASSVFLLTLLPILMVLFFNIPVVVGMAMALLIVPQLFLLIIRMRSGSAANIPGLQLIYTLLMHLFIFLSPVRMLIADNMLILIIGLLIIPQMGVYIHKLLVFSEFRHPRMKLLIRLLFITAYFFALIYLKSNMVGGIVLILGVVLVFYRLRSLSSTIIESNGENGISFPYFVARGSFISQLFSRYNVFNRQTRILLRSNRGRVQDVVKIIFIVLGFLFLVFTGIIILVSNAAPGCAPDCAPDCSPVCGNCCGDCCGGCDCSPDCNC